MAGVLFSLPIARQLSVSGEILPGWTATFYLTQTTTAADVYADGDLEDSLGNIVEADADGHMPPIYLDPDVTYRVLIKDANGVLQPDGDVDPIDVSRGEGGGGGEGPAIARGFINFDGTLQSGSIGIDSVSMPETGIYMITFEAGFFENRPAILVTPLVGEGGVGVTALATASSSSAEVQLYTGNTPVIFSFQIMAIETDQTEG